MTSTGEARGGMVRLRTMQPRQASRARRRSSPGMPGQEKWWVHAYDSRRQAMPLFASPRLARLAQQEGHCMLRSQAGCVVAAVTAGIIKPASFKDAFKAVDNQQEDELWKQ